MLMKILKSKKAFWSLLLILFLEAISAFWYLKKPTQLATRNSQPTISKTSQPVSLFLDPSAAEFPTGKEFQVAIVLSTGQKSAIGADVILKYDPEKLEVLEITPGQIFELYPELEIQEEKVLISAISQEGKLFSGQGILAQLVLKGKVPGETKLKFEFEPGQTTDSNVAIENTQPDGLEEVKNGSYTFK